ncbi:hypothetical protein JK636_06530 [Clostridium sp. YIM B02515]|uniref:Transglutaminase-like domain-containing protein n=1 Tax=Clostridium rhizosphaerae TaxID=2803861 RepID=A0ABS1T8G6_9CLOT|nr:transglutaminase domain-containing protein [Clostridium rhizosphaerae]MBL4935412.1 hypothetical protein [Clostridium rhizosphaerae]
MNRFKKSIIILLSVSMLWGCAAKPSGSISAKGNDVNIDSSKQQTNVVQQAVKKEENNKVSTASNNTQSSSQKTSGSTSSNNKTSTLPKSNNTPKKIVAEAPKVNPPAKPQVVNTVEKVQIPVPPPAQSSNQQTNTEGQGQQTQTAAQNQASSVSSIPGLPAINYEVSSYNDYYKTVYNSLKNFESSVYIKVNNYDSNIFNLNVIDSLMIDNYDIDYGLTSVKARIYSMGNINVLNIQFQYKFSKDKLLSMRDTSESKAKQIISEIIKPGMSDLDKEKAIHDYIVSHTSYDYNDYINGTLPGTVFNDYGVFINGSAVCEGYSKAMLKLMRMAGLEAKSVTGYGIDGGNKIPHAWNMVKINGVYTLVDATWDDPVPDEKGKVYYNYFDVSDSQLSKDHQWDTSKYPRASAIQVSAQ